jgi:hypothetical protein
MKIKVLAGITGWNFVLYALFQALALSGMNFGEVPHVSGWQGALLTVLFAMAGALVMQWSLKKTESTTRL